jgi:galactose mutarotase-like enzyme
VRGWRPGERHRDRALVLITLIADGGAVRLDVDDHAGGRIERLVVEGLDLLVPPEVNDHNYGAFAMAPWAGRLRHGRFAFNDHEHQLPLNKPPHAIHGTVRDLPWTVDHESPDAAEWSTALSDPWPFSGRVVQRATLALDSLALEMEVHAVGQPMPASCGWHPWWSRQLSRGDGVELELHAGQMYRRDDEDIPTGELVGVQPPPWDDCFTDLHAPAAVLHWPDAARLAIETDCPCVVVFTDPDHAVCVEPQSGPPDELNLEPRVVVPGEPLVVHTTWSWTVSG